MSAPRVVITGMGGVTPIGTGLDAIWESARTGRSGIGPITVFDASNQQCRIAGQVRGFEPGRYMPAKHLKRMDDFARYAVASAVMAVEDAKLEITLDNSRRIGVLLGNNNGGARTIFRTVDRRSRPRARAAVSPFYITAITSNMASAQVAIRLQVRGPNFTIGNACASGLNGIGEAWRYIRDGDVRRRARRRHRRLDRRAPRSPASRTRARCRCATTSPSARAGRSIATATASCCRRAPRSRSSSRSTHAQARGARIYAEIVGYATGSEAFHIAAPLPDGIGVAACMQAALESAGIAPDDDRLRERARHLDAARRHQRDPGHQARVRRARAAAPGERHQVDDRPPDRRLGRARDAGHGEDARDRHHHADHQPRQPRSRVRPRLRPAHRAAAPTCATRSPTRSASAAPTRRSCCGDGTAERRLASCWSALALPARRAGARPCSRTAASPTAPAAADGLARRSVGARPDRRRVGAARGRRSGIGAHRQPRPPTTRGSARRSPSCPGATYRVSARVKTDDVGIDDRGRADRARAAHRRLGRRQGHAGLADASRSRAANGEREQRGTSACGSAATPTSTPARRGSPTCAVEQIGGRAGRQRRRRGGRASDSRRCSPRCARPRGCRPRLPLVGGVLLAFGLGIFGRRPR